MNAKPVLKTLSTVISAIFLLLTLAVVFSTIILDKTVVSRFPNTVRYNNYIYYITAAFILAAVVLTAKKLIETDISKKAYIICSVITVAFVCAAQLNVSLWAVTNSHGDFGAVREAAEGLSQGKSFADYNYFTVSPNNANIAILLSWLYNLFPHWRALVYLGALLTNLSAVFVSLTVKNITRSRYASLAALIVSEILAALTWRAYIVYTDNYAMPFIIAPLWLYTSNYLGNYKMPATAALCAAGCFIKVTALIVAAAIFTHYLLFNSDALKRVKIINVIIGAAVLASVFLIQNPVRAAYGLNISGYPKGWQYMFLVGQNTDYSGLANGEDIKIRNLFIEEARALNKDAVYLNAKLTETAKLRIKERGIWGNIKFYLKKLNIAYNDGYFHNTQLPNLPAEQRRDGDITFRLLWKSGDFYQISAGIMQVLWDYTLLLLLIGALAFWNLQRAFPFEICIIAVTVYLMLFEGRAKYLYMFLPVYLSLAGVALYKISTLDYRKIFNRYRYKISVNPKPPSSIFKFLPY